MQAKCPEWPHRNKQIFVSTDMVSRQIGQQSSLWHPFGREITFKECSTNFLSFSRSLPDVDSTGPGRATSSPAALCTDMIVSLWIALFRGCLPKSNLANLGVRLLPEFCEADAEGDRTAGGDVSCTSELKVVIAFSLAVLRIKRVENGLETIAQ